MKLNLGCGKDLRRGYLNVDFFDLPELPSQAFQKVDLSTFPWPWKDSSVDEVLMIDFLEHFPYAQTEVILRESNRVLKKGGLVDIQVPDFSVCALAALGGEHVGKRTTQCNACGCWLADRSEQSCERCGIARIEVKIAAIKRLYGGQDRDGNWHYTAFTREILEHHLRRCGFTDFLYQEYNENGETMSQNWNFRVKARKIG